MKTIAFATTQMNLINCVEYLSTLDGDNVLFLKTDTIIRKNQILELLRNPAYTNVFKKIIKFPNTDNRMIDFLFTCLYLLVIKYISFTKTYDIVITGHYKNFFARNIFMKQYKKNPNCQLIACDDGLVTKVLAQKRLEELRTGSTCVFIPNRIIKHHYNRKLKDFIPNKVIFFSVSEFELEGNDRIVINRYRYLKEHLDDFNINLDTFNCKAIILGQPLYDTIITKQCYVNKLRKYAEEIEGKVCYYSHPAERKVDWDKLGLSESYNYVQNFVPFEIISAILPDSCRVATFFSSVLMNLSIMNPTLKPECLSIRREELLDDSFYPNLASNYDHYHLIGVTFYEFV